jgi:hypothetical protein
MSTSTLLHTLGLRLACAAQRHANAAQLTAHLATLPFVCNVDHGVVVPFGGRKGTTTP